MTITTAARKGTPVQLLRGVDAHGDGFRARLSFDGKIHGDVYPTANEANARILELRALRAAGLAPNSTRTVTLGQAATELLDAKLLEVSRKTGRELTPAGRTWWVRVTRPWREGDYAATPVHLLNPREVAAWIRRRAADHPKSGRDELTALKAILRYAAADGAQVPARLLELEPPAKRQPRKRRALSPAELRLLAASAPPAYQRMLLLQGTVGNRISELLQLRRSDVDLAAATMLIADPKEGRAKLIDLLPAEVTLLREQLAPLRSVGASATAHLPATPVGAELVWPMPDGRAFPAHSYFGRLVWAPARKAATAAWQGSGDCPFVGLTSHDLRSTAITIARDLGIPAEACAFRVGHADGGLLVRRIYDAGSQRDRAERVYAALAPEGLLEAAEKAAGATITTAPAAQPKGTLR